MHDNFRFLRFSLLGLGLIAAVGLIACTTPQATEPEAQPTDASVMAPTGADPSGTNQEVPISAFVQQHTEISQEWDQFHGDFDEWSASLSACHPNAMRDALNDFAVSFNSVTEQARDLSRGKTSGELADLVIVAAENEEMALRQLRDRWQPNNVSLFENVEQYRAKASQAQKSAEDRAIELKDGFEDKADPEATEAFLEVFEPIADSWKQLHDDYESLRDEADDLGAAAVREGIEQHAETLETIIDGLDELPELDGAEDTVEELLTAANAELEAFEAATGSGTAATATAAASTGSTTTGASGSASSTETATTESAATGDATDTESAGTSNGEKMPDLAPLDEITEANAKTLKQASGAIEDLADPDAGKGLVELQVFGTEYTQLARDWDAFHDRYNSWRKNDGGCDRTQVIQNLEQHSLRIAELGRNVRTLSSSGSLLPIYSLLTEAAARDENAIRTLRYTWQPFALDTFKAVHQERTNTDSLRRQAAIAVQELENRS